jgi:hypothetical protein
MFSLILASGRTWSRSGSFDEIHFFAQDFEVFNADIGRDVDPGGAFAHLGFDENLALLTGDRDAVMAVYDEVDFADFVEHDRRQADVVVKSQVDTLPALGCFYWVGRKARSNWW